MYRIAILILIFTLGFACSTTPENPGDWQLFNLQDDPEESENLADQHPQTVSELHQMFVLHRNKDKKN